GLAAILLPFRVGWQERLLMSMTVESSADRPANRIGAFWPNLRSPDLQRNAPCAQMSSMRAALGILRLPCALLAGIALASAAPAIPASSQAARIPPIPLAGPASGAAAPHALKPQDLLFACPTTRDHVGRV